MNNVEVAVVVPVETKKEDTEDVMITTTITRRVVHQASTHLSSEVELVEGLVVRLLLLLHLKSIKCRK